MIKRKIHICPQCGNIFKNFKWRKDWKYDLAACCPQCNLPAYKWKEYNAQSNQTERSK